MAQMADGSIRAIRSPSRSRSKSPPGHEAAPPHHSSHHHHGASQFAGFSSGQTKFDESLTDLTMEFERVTKSSFSPEARTPNPSLKVKGLPHGLLIGPDAHRKALQAEKGLKIMHGDGYTGSATSPYGPGPGSEQSALEQANPVYNPAHHPEPQHFMDQRMVRYAPDPRQPEQQRSDTHMEDVIVRADRYNTSNFRTESPQGQGNDRYNTMQMRQASVRGPAPEPRAQEQPRMAEMQPTGVTTLAPSSRQQQKLLYDSHMAQLVSQYEAQGGASAASPVLDRYRHGSPLKPRMGGASAFRFK
eukprot:TRINITY_DN12414_c0_g1_i1.p1 TRINITY_DN12414_c0_g1~~TRINITY_DN12414_c0_g1_i1.p1  ORF type:complete len:302 (-),score=58.86 TRINITY_DN12414_c0_g1_i1:156-1061(-)